MLDWEYSLVGGLGVQPSWQHACWTSGRTRFSHQHFIPIILTLQKQRQEDRKSKFLLGFIGSLGQPELQTLSQKEKKQYSQVGVVAHPVHTYMWSPEVNMRHLFQSHSILLFKTRSLTEPGACWLASGIQESRLRSSCFQGQLVTTSQPPSLEFG